MGDIYMYESATVEVSRQSDVHTTGHDLFCGVLLEAVCWAVAAHHYW